MTRHFLRDDDLSPAEQARGARARRDAQARRRTTRRAAGRAAHGRDDLRQADAAHPGVVRGRHRRARRQPDDGRRLAGRDRHARVGRRRRAGARPAGVGDRLADLRARSALEEMAAYAGVPVVNALTDEFHPCQLLADLLTIREHKGELAGLDGRLRRRRRLQHGQLLAARRRHRRACTCGSARPRATSPSRAVRRPGPRDRAGRPAARPSCVPDPGEAVAGADVVVTDTWVSMGKEEEAAARLAAFGAYTVTADLLPLADADAIVHALPAGLPRQGDRRRRARRTAERRLGRGREPPPRPEGDHHLAPRGSATATMST